MTKVKVDVKFTSF